GDLLAVLGEDRLGAGVLEDVRDLVRGKGGVDRDVGRADELAGVVGDRPLDAVVREDRDAVAAPDADRRERAGAGPDAATEFLARHRAPGPARLLDEAVGPREPVDALEKNIGERGGVRGHSPVYHERLAR